MATLETSDGLLFRRHQIHTMLLDEGAPEDVLETTVGTLLAEKGTHVETVPATITARAAVQRMEIAGIGSVVVVDREGELLGLFTERDYLRAITLGDMADDTPVILVTPKQIPCVSMGTTVKSCMSIMTELRVRHLPVLHKGRLRGLVSIGDCTRQVALDSAYERRLLVSYICGGFCG